MANRIFIQDYSRNDIAMDFPLIDDVQPEFSSAFGSFGDVVPKVSDILDTVSLASAGGTGSIGASVLASKNLFDIPRWKKTEPVKLQVKLVFDLKTDPENDIFEPMKKIISYSILTSNSDGSYTVPGISLASIEAFQSSGGEKGIMKNAKLVSISIPGVVFLPVAMIERVQAIFSKEITESGYPLWGTLDASIIGTFPANTKMLDDAKILARGASIPPGL